MIESDTISSGKRPLEVRRGGTRCQKLRIHIEAQAATIAAYEATILEYGHQIEERDWLIRDYREEVEKLTARIDELTPECGQCDDCVAVCPACSGSGGLLSACCTCGGSGTVKCSGCGEDGEA